MKTRRTIFLSYISVFLLSLLKYVVVDQTMKPKFGAHQSSSLNIQL